MIKKVKIINFKSIKKLDLECTRVNIFIGEPNTGKSNILEALGIISSPYSKSLKDFIRFKSITNIFYDNVYKNNISITFNNNRTNYKLGIKYIDGSIDGTMTPIPPKVRNRSDLWFSFRYSLNNSTPHFFSFEKFNGFIKYYKFRSFEKYTGYEIDFLRPPYGENLVQLIANNKYLEELVIAKFKEYGYNILLSQFDNELDFFKIVDNSPVRFPFFLSADTIQRMVFYTSILETNENSSIILEEPEAHVFPFYNKFMAERIALYNKNQFFIATHNPTFLSNLIEQTPDKELVVYITYYENYQTKVMQLKGKKLRETYKLFGRDIFGNLEKIIKNLDKILAKERKDSK